MRPRRAGTAAGALALAALLFVLRPGFSPAESAARGASRTIPGAADALTFRTQEIARDFGVGYAVRVADVSGDGRLDVVAISPTRLVWFENPDWTPHVALDGVTPKDNVTIAPHDIDGDGRVDVAIGAAWNPRNTTSGGTLHWAARSEPSGKQPWRLHAIGEEPTLHRIRWADVDGSGRPALVVTPLHGRGTSPPEWQGAGARTLIFRVPPDPVRDAWPSEVADDTLHILHNFLVTDLDGRRGDELVMASREGVTALARDAGGRWTRTRLGEGAPGEVVLGRVGGRRLLATVEPWHGTSVVVYAEQPGLWARQVVEDGITGGHALAWADLDGDGDDELAVGWRDGKPTGVAVYDIAPDGRRLAKTMVDEGGMATEDLVAADLDGNGRPDLVAAGRATANIRIYWR